jgi:hypothetical protein
MYIGNDKKKSAKDAKERGGGRRVEKDRYIFIFY